MLGIGNSDVRAKFRNLESGIEEFYRSSRLGIGNGGVRAKFQAWNRKMEEFDPSSEVWNRE